VAKIINIGQDSTGKKVSVPTFTPDHPDPRPASGNG
jgi:hypothetical protein